MELGPLAPDHISVNLSRNQLVQPDLPEVIGDILHPTGVPPSCLHLEITESAVMEDIASGTRMLHAIGVLGVRQSLDDFGTGHSSLAALHDFPVQVLKIDRAFIANIEPRTPVRRAGPRRRGAGVQPGHGGCRRGRRDPGAGRGAAVAGVRVRAGVPLRPSLPVDKVAGFLRSWSADDGLARAA